MNRISLLIVIAIAVVLPATAEEIGPPLDAGLVDLIPSESIGKDDVVMLEQLRLEGGLNQCLAEALLFKHDRELYRDDFHAYFRVDKDSPTVPQSTEEVNSIVNGMMKTYKGRSQIEIFSRIYLEFKGTDKTNIRRDGLEIYLEVMFRASLFMGIFNPSKEELLKLSAIADYNK